MGFSLRRCLLAVLSRAECGVTQSEWKRLRFSYAQHGEDIVAEALLPQDTGFYVEVGAFHPVSISNTYLFYRKGWRGIVIDPSPDTAALFRRRRPGDLFLPCAVSDVENVRRFDLMPAGETSHLEGSGAFTGSAKPALRSIQVACRRLASILNESLPPGKPIDFLSVDTEGHDLNVLKSNDWNKYRPRVIAVEDFQTAAESPVCRFLAEHGYVPAITARITRFFAPGKGH